jgi:hypothetical protein
LRQAELARQKQAKKKPRFGNAGLQDFSTAQQKIKRPYLKPGCITIPALLKLIRVDE